ncbi:MAG: MCP four helix bundle domain-containing protein [Oligoflexia bacterium]|nr:MCP four helix bundle domain-containing protein [Oligoflexia bacterium]
MSTKMKIDKKIIILSAALIAFLVITSLIAFFAIQKVTNITYHITKVLMPSERYLSVIDKGQISLKEVERSLLLRRLDANIRKTIYDRREEISKHIDQAWKAYEPLEQSADEAIEWKQFIGKWNTWKEHHEKVVTLIKQKDEKLAQMKLLSEVEALKLKSEIDKLDDKAFNLSMEGMKYFAIAETSLEELLKIQGKNTKIAEDSSNTTSNSVYWLIFIFSISAIITSIFISISIIRSIVQALATSITSLSDCSTQVGSASQEVSSGSQQVSQASSEQASSIEETSAALEEMNGQINNNLENAKSALELSEKVVGISEEAKAAMEQLQRAMHEILKSNEKIEQLVKVIDNIGEKTEIMDEIVFQTKLLSFNASVEAERAGEHGRGFAVVAQEVGNLAQMSGKAAQEIAQIVKDSIRQAEAVSNENKSKVDEGYKLVEETSRVLQEIGKKAQIVQKAASQVLTASNEQASGIRQINSAVEQLDKAIQENASTSEETASAAEELNSQVDTLKQVVVDLSSLISKGDSIERQAASITKQVHLNTQVAAKLKLNKHEHNNVIPLKRLVVVAKEEEGAPKQGKASGDWESL